MRKTQTLLLGWVLIALMLTSYVNAASVTPTDKNSIPSLDANIATSTDEAKKDLTNPPPVSSIATPAETVIPSKSVATSLTKTTKPISVPVVLAPTNLEARSGGDRILIAWEPVILPNKKQVRYQVFRNSTPLTGAWQPGNWPTPLNKQPLEETYYLDAPGLSWQPPEKNKTYFYTVLALDSQSNSSSASKALQVMNIPLLCAPSAVKAIPGNRSVKLEWLPSFSGGSAGLCGYMIYRSTKPGDQGEPMFTEPLKAEMFVDRGPTGNGLANGLKYYYTFFAQDNLGQLSDPVEQVSAIPFAPPTAPRNLTATGKSDDMIELNWKGSAAGDYNLTGYNIYRKTEKSELEGPINKKLITKTHFVDSAENSTSKPILGRVYTYTIKAVDAKGNESLVSNEMNATPMKPIEIRRSGITTSIPGLPPDSSLTISGRKKIDIGYTDVVALNISKDATGKEVNTDRSPSITSGLSKGFELKQELQVRLEGKVGKKITVDVDYDDTQEEQRKISIIYAGDPDDVVQEAAFGDILLDLPRTEFAGYNKNLFGAKLKVGFDNFRFTAIGAQTKGVSATETFKGNTSQRIVDINDTSFVSYKYYYITKDWPNQVNHPNLPIYATPNDFYNTNQKQHGIVPLSVDIWQNNGVVDTNSRAVTIGGNSTTSNVYYNRMSPGIDYTVDYQTGLITFSQSRARTHSIAVAYKYLDENNVEHSVGYNSTGDIDLESVNLNVPADGRVSDTAHLIQLSYSTDADLSKNNILMIMNRYSLGYKNIMDPQSDSDFVISIKGSSGNDYSIPSPTDTVNADKIYKIDPNFGTIDFRHNYPFKAGTIDNASTKYLADDYDGTLEDAYSSTWNTTLGGSNNNTAHNYSIHIEFKNLISTFNLSHWNVIKDSEVIKKDGLKLQKNTDYFIDYDTGFITFLNPGSIASSSEITITYEYMPFGGSYQTNIFGARAEYDIIEKRLSIGSTFLYNASQAPTDIPDVNSSPTSLSLIDGDVKLTLNPEDFSKIVSPIIKDAKIPLSIEATAEAAYSTFEVNSYRKSGEAGVAMVDNMDGSDNVFSLPVGSNANNIWFPSSVPAGGSFTAADMRNYINQSVVYEFGRNPIDSNDKKHQLRWNYSGMTNGNWDGFVYPVSTSGSNFHEYRYLEMVIYSEQAINLNIDIGVVSEDSNGNNHLNFEGDRQNKTADYDKGIINWIKGRDTNNQPIIEQDILAGTVGEGAYPVGANSGYWGDGNGQIDNEDLDNNDTLDTDEKHLEYTISLEPGWNVKKIPLSSYTTPIGGAISTATDPNFMSNVKHVRMWVTGQNAISSSGYLQFESVNLTGNKWLPEVDPDAISNTYTAAEVPAEKMNVIAISKETSDNYVPNKNFMIIDTLENEEEQLRTEKALKITYSLSDADLVNAASTTLTTKSAYYFTRSLSTQTGYNYSDYRYLRFDIYKISSSPANEQFFVRLAIDEKNYYQYNVSLSDYQPVGAWHTVLVELDGRDGKRTEEFQDGVLPGLHNVKEISIGIFNPNFDPNPPAREIWINNLRVTGAKSKEGLAYRVSTSTKYGDVFTVNTDHREVGSDFFKIDDSPKGKQHQVNSSVTGSITKFNFLPITASWSRNESFTEQEHRDDLAYSNSFSTPDKFSETVRGNIGYNQISGLSLNVTANRTRKVTEYIEQITQANNTEQVSTVNPHISYKLPSKILNFNIGSTTLTGKLTYTDSETAYDADGVSKVAEANPSASNTFYNKRKVSLQETYTYAGNYIPIRFLRVSPSFTYSETRDKGNLSLYRFYGDLNAEDKYYSDVFKKARVNKDANISVNILNVPVLSPSVNYRMTNTRDYIQDSLSTPGTLSWQTGIAFGELIGWSKFPRINFNQSYTLSATYRNENRVDNTSSLNFDDLWIIDPLTFESNDDEKSYLAKTYINSRKKSETISTTLNFIPNLSISPQYSWNWTKTMNTADNYFTTEVLSFGGGINWSKVPSFKWLTFQAMNIDYRYSQNKKLDTADVVTSDNASHVSTLTLPFRITNDLSGSMTFKANNAIKQSGTNLSTKQYQNEYNPGISLSYNLRMVDPIKLPSFWPFNGALIKIEQTLRLTNSFNIKWIDDYIENDKLSDKKTEEYTNDTTINYSLWRNVEGDVKITNQWFFNHSQIDKDYWAISIKAGISAVF